MGVCIIIPLPLPPGVGRSTRVVRPGPFGLEGGPDGLLTGAVAPVEGVRAAIAAARRSLPFICG